jgi:hypothetical protein
MGLGLVIGFIIGIVFFVLFFGYVAMSGFATAYLLAADKVQNRLLRFLAGSGGAVTGIVGGILFIAASMVIMMWWDECKTAFFRKKETSPIPTASRGWHTIPSQWQMSKGRMVRLEFRGGQRLVDESGSTIRKLSSGEAIRTSVVSDQRTCLLLMIHVFRPRSGAADAWEYDHLLRVMQGPSGQWQVSRVLRSPALEGAPDRPIVLLLDSVSDDGATARICVREKGSTIGPLVPQIRSLDDPTFAGNRNRR